MVDLLLDGGFELPVLLPGTAIASPGGGGLWSPPGSPWQFSATDANQAGIAANGSAVIAGNANAPQGQQVAFMVDTCALVQRFSLLAPWSDPITFQAAVSTQSLYPDTNRLEIDIDGVSVGAPLNITSRPGYALYSTAPLRLAVGEHRIVLTSFADPLAMILLDTIGIPVLPPPAPFTIRLTHAPSPDPVRFTVPFGQTGRLVHHG